MPVVGSGGMTMLRSVLPGNAAKVVPSGFVTVMASNALAPGKPRFSLWPAIPEKVKRARWPGRAMLTGTGVPPATMEPTTRSCDSVMALLPV